METQWIDGLELPMPAPSYHADIYSDHRVGISLRHLRIVPPVSEETAKKIADVIGGEHIETKPDWSEIVIRDSVTPAEELWKRVESEISETGSILRHLSELAKYEMPENPGLDDFRILMSRVET